MRKIVFIALCCVLLQSIALASEKYMKFPSGTPGKMFFPTTACSDTQILQFNASGAMACAAAPAGGSGDLLADGSIPLTADWDVGLFDITAVEFNGALIGNASTASALAANPAAATAGSVITDIAADGSVEGEVDVWTEAENTSAGYTSTADEVGTLTTGDLCINDGSSVNCTVNTIAELETALDATDILIAAEGDAAYQPLDSELTTISGLTETNDNVMFVAGGAWTSDATPAIDCTDCTNVPAGTVLKDIVTTTPLTVDAGANLDDVLSGADADVTFAIIMLKDIVTTAPLTGAADDVLPGADADLTLAMPVATTSADGYLAQADWDTFNNKAPTDSPTFTTAFTATGLIGDEDLQSEDFGEFTCAGEDACTIDDSVAVTSWNLTTPTITTSLTTDSKTISEAEIGRLDGLAGVITTDTTAVTEVDGRSLTIATATLNADEETYIYKAKIAFEDPVATDDFFFGELTHAVTFTSIYCKTLVGTVTLDVTSGGTDIEGTDIVCDTDGQSDAGISNASGSVIDEIKLAITSVASAPTYLFVQLNGTYDD